MQNRTRLTGLRFFYLCAGILLKCAGAMMIKKSLSIKEFNYDLPDSAVAKYPLPERDQSKLLVWDKGEKAG